MVYKNKDDEIKARKRYYWERGGKEKMSKWGKSNPERRRESERKKRLKLKDKVFLHYGGYKCACCGETHKEFLCIDHINGGGNKHRKTFKISFNCWLRKNNYPDGFRVLCMNCNHSLGIFGYCPHNIKK